MYTVFVRMTDPVAALRMSSKVVCSMKGFRSICSCCYIAVTKLFTSCTKTYVMKVLRVACQGLSCYLMP